jgi:hypothetical protein
MHKLGPELGYRRPDLRSGRETFHQKGHTLDFDIQSFWQWGFSDLLSNSLRGVLAEFLVAQALGLDLAMPRDEWGSYDLVLPDGRKIEVKASGYLQSWHQDQLSKVVFDIKPTLAWDPATNKFEKRKKRQSDIYIFALLQSKDKTRVDPMDLDQWAFYILPTQILDQKMGEKKSVSLKQLEALTSPVQFGHLRDQII